MEETLDSTDNSLNIFVLEMIVLPLEPLIWTFSKIALDSRGLAIAKEEEEIFKFAISLLGATIQNSGIKERSNDII